MTIAAAFSPFAIATPETERRRRLEERTDSTPEITDREVAPQEATMAARVSRNRRVTSNHNTFQTVCVPANDVPPPYATVSRQRPCSRRRFSERYEVLPDYTCTVFAEAKVLLNLEAVSPLHKVTESEWREVYVVVEGTILNIYRVKDASRGKLLKTYTLQHAETGLAPDSSHTVLVPSSKFAHLIPAPARRKAHQRDPSLFNAQRQHILRLRVETDQIVIAHHSEQKIYELIEALSAGIDIASPIDERSITRQCTVPRRRRRRQAQFNGDLANPALIAEQAHIMREMYPGLADSSHDERPELLLRRDTAACPVSTENTQAHSREDDDIDFSEMREESRSNTADPHGRPSTPPQPSQRPPISRSTTTQSIMSTLSDGMLHATNPSNFNHESGKWQPPSTRTDAQIQRYTRRCMPILLTDAVRASDILICEGRRMKINWRMELLEDWELKPPSYKSHGFTPSRSSIARSASTTSSSATRMTPQSSTLLLDAQDGVPSANDALTLRKFVSPDGKGNAIVQVTKAQPPKPRRARHDPYNDAHGVVFCF